MKKNTKFDKVLSIILMILLLVLLSTIIYKVVANGPIVKYEDEPTNEIPVSISVEKEPKSTNSDKEDNDLENINLDENNMIKYYYNDIKNYEITNRVPIKTNYTPIVVEVKSVYTNSDYGVMNVNIYNNQNSIEDSRRIDPVNNINIASEEYFSNKWSETEPLIFEIKDDNDNTVFSYNYDYTRMDLIKNEKLIFKKGQEYSKLKLNIYLNNEKHKTLVGVISVDLTDEYKKETYTLDTDKIIGDGNIKLKTSSKWNFLTYKESPNTFEIMANDEKNKNIELIFEQNTNENLEYYGIQAYTDIKDLTQKYAEYEMNSFDEYAIVDHGDYKIGDFSGYQITYYAKSNGTYYKSKIMYTSVNDNIYAIKISANSERAYDNNIQFCEKIVESIKIQ